MSKVILDISEFTDEEQRAFLLLADGVRRRHRHESLRPGFVEFWEKISVNRTSMDDEEVDAIVADAMAFARGQA